jgi:serine/threonine-protein kinase
VLLDRYEVQQRIGAGATGAAYRARDRLGEGSAGYVVVKFLHGREAREPALVERFRVEALAGALVPHRGVARTIAWAASEALAVLIREYVPGRSLMAALREDGTPSVARAVEITAELADALATAHDVGVVHRDVKPQNIYLTPDGFGGEAPRLIDFGFAQVRLPDGTYLGLTRPGVVIGTPAYMSPEQTRHGAIDGRADLYSLGVVLYRLLTGRRPLSGRNVAEQLKLNRELVPLSPRRSSPEREIPRALDAITMRLLEKSPDRRFSDAHAVAQALRSVRLRDPAPAVRRAERPQPPPLPDVSSAGIFAVPRLSMAGLAVGFMRW